MLSGGQAMLADLKFLKGLTNALGGLGCIFLDETFKFFSPKTITECFDTLNTLNIDSIFLIIHAEVEGAGKTIEVSLTDAGSKYMF